MLSDRCMCKVRQYADTINTQILRKHFYVVVYITISSHFHVGKHNFMNPENTLMNFLWKDGIHTLIESFRQQYFLSDVRRWIIF